MKWLQSPSTWQITPKEATIALHTHNQSRQGIGHMPSLLVFNFVRPSQQLSQQDIYIVPKSNAHPDLMQFHP
jgi:hypothetical protein